MNCPKCGSKLNKGAAFCPYCGIKLSINPAPQQTPAAGGQQSSQQTPAAGGQQSSQQTPAADGQQALQQTAAATPQKAPVAGTQQTPGVTPQKASATGTQHAPQTVPRQPAAGTAAKRPEKAVLLLIPAVGLFLLCVITLATFVLPRLFGGKENRALSELSELLQQGESIVQKSYDDFHEIDTDEDDYLASYKARAEVWNNAAAQLEELEEKKDGIGGLDAKSKEAADNYFELTVFSENTLGEVYGLITTYFELGFDQWPRSDGYDTTVDYYNALLEWYEPLKEKLDEDYSVPSCLETEWNNYLSNFELNESILQKMYYAYNLNDFLRFHSAINLSNRCEARDDQLFDELLDGLGEEMDFAVYQKSIATKLAEEVEKYAGLNNAQRENYEFENIRMNKINLNYDVLDEIYASLYRSYDAFAIIRTGCLGGRRDITVEAEIPGFTQKYRQTFHLDPSYKAIFIKPPMLTGELDLGAAKDAQINISIYEKDGTTLVDSKSFPVVIKSKNDFCHIENEYGMSTRENLLCWLTPNDSAIDQMKRLAIDEISNMTNGNIQAMVGYQDGQFGHYVGTYLQAAGIMRALYDTGVRYNMDPYSSDAGSQHILYPGEVLRKQSGLCIETSLTMASALQSAGMNVFLVLPTGHAQVAVEIWDGGGEGTGEYFLIETTALSSDNNNDDIYIDYANILLENNPDDAPINYPISYYSAGEWADYIEQTGAYIIDCGDAASMGLASFSN